MDWKVKTVVIVDDDDGKIRFAEDAVHRVFGPDTVIRMLYVHGDGWSHERVVRDVLVQMPQLVIMDARLIPNEGVTLQGLMIARDLTAAFREGDIRCLVVANTHGSAGWNFRVTRRLFERHADVHHGASTDAELEALLKQIHEGHIDS